MTDRQQLRDRVTALAGVFQAAVLVDDIATRGETSSRAFASSVNSLFALDADRVADIFPDTGGLATGRDFLGAVLRRETGRDSTGRVGYVMAMLHLNGVLRGDHELQQLIRTRLGQIAASGGPATERTADDTIAKIAALYVDTFGKLSYRVQVKGDPNRLPLPEIAARIRASLFAGIRAAHLWHHLGGRRWHLLFGSGRMLELL